MCVICPGHVQVEWVWIFGWTVSPSQKSNEHGAKAGRTSISCPSGWTCSVYILQCRRSVTLVRSPSLHLFQTEQMTSMCSNFWCLRCIFHSVEVSSAGMDQSLEVLSNDTHCFALCAGQVWRHLKCLPSTCDTSHVCTQNPQKKPLLSKQTCFIDVPLDSKFPPCIVFLKFLSHGVITCSVQCSFAH